MIMIVGCGERGGGRGVGGSESIPFEEWSR